MRRRGLRSDGKAPLFAAAENRDDCSRKSASENNNLDSRVRMQRHNFQTESSAYPSQRYLLVRDTGPPRVNAEANVARLDMWDLLGLVKNQHVLQ